MKLEVGKTYISQLGTKVKIVSDEGIAPFQFIGVLDSGCPSTFSEDGSNHILAIQLKEEFKEKPVLNLKLNDLYKWAAMDFNKRWFLYKGKPALGTAMWNNLSLSSDSVMRIPAEFTPTYSGDWKDSLIEL
jgi:hypothetical protein